MEAFAPGDLERVLAETFVEHLDYHPEIASTSTRALELARQLAKIPSVTLVLTDRQTAGRGRGANRWWSGDGGLAFSLLTDCDALGLPARRWPMISLTAGLAVCDAIDHSLNKTEAKLKWPNDVYLRGCKVCGILVEVPDSRWARVVIGIGMNVNNSSALAPLELQGQAIALQEIAGSELSRIDLLIAILLQLSGRLTELSTESESLQRDWQRRCLLTGQQVQIQQDTRELSGMCHGIDQDGALLVQTDLGIERCLSGTVMDFSTG